MPGAAPRRASCNYWRGPPPVSAGLTDGCVAVEQAKRVWSAMVPWRKRSRRSHLIRTYSKGSISTKPLPRFISCKHINSLSWLTRVTCVSRTRSCMSSHGRRHAQGAERAWLIGVSVQQHEGILAGVINVEALHSHSCIQHIYIHQQTRSFMKRREGDGFMAERGRGLRLLGTSLGWRWIEIVLHG